MSWAMRVSTALVVAFAMATVPLVMDWCAASCEAAAHASTPPCHHASLSGPRIGHSPTPRGHDHNATVTNVTPETVSVGQGLIAVLTTTVDPVTVMTTVPRFGVSCASPPHEPLSRQLAAALRV